MFRSICGYFLLYFSELRIEVVDFIKLTKTSNNDLSLKSLDYLNWNIETRITIFGPDNIFLN